MTVLIKVWCFLKGVSLPPAKKQTIRQNKQKSEAGASAFYEEKRKS